MIAYHGLVAVVLVYVFDGTSNPTFREPTIYMLFWISVAMATALSRITREGAAGGTRRVS